MNHKLTRTIIRTAGFFAATTILVLAPAVPGFAHTAGVPPAAPHTSGLATVIDELARRPRPHAD